MSIQDERGHWKLYAEKCIICGKLFKQQEKEFHSIDACMQFESYEDFYERIHDPTQPYLDLSLLPNADKNPLLKDTLAFRKEIEAEKNLIPNSSTIWRSDQPMGHAHSWNEDPSNLVFPTMVTFKQEDFSSDISEFKSAIENGLEYAQECLAEHDVRLGRTIKRNKEYAQIMEKDISQMRNALERLEKYEYTQNNP